MDLFGGGRVVVGDELDLRSFVEDNAFADEVVVLVFYVFAEIGVADQDLEASIGSIELDLLVEEDHESSLALGKELPKE